MAKEKRLEQVAFEQYGGGLYTSIIRDTKTGKEYLITKAVSNSGIALDVKELSSDEKGSMSDGLLLRGVRNE